MNEIEYEVKLFPSLTLKKCQQLVLEHEARLVVIDDLCALVEGSALVRRFKGTSQTRVVLEEEEEDQAAPAMEIPSYTQEFMRANDEAHGRHFSRMYDLHHDVQMLWQECGYTTRGFKWPMELSDLERRMIGLSIDDYGAGSSGPAGGGGGDENYGDDSFYDLMELF